MALGSLASTNRIAPWDKEPWGPPVLPHVDEPEETAAAWRLRQEKGSAAMDAMAQEGTNGHETAPARTDVQETPSGSDADDADDAGDDPGLPGPPPSAEMMAAHERDGRERDACMPDREDFLYRSWRHSCPYPEPLPPRPRRNPPARVTLPLAGQGCSIEMFARETGWSATYIRKWFTAHPEGCSSAGHGEEMHRGAYRSLRLSPLAREHFLAAHRPKQA